MAGTHCIYTCTTCLLGMHQPCSWGKESTWRPVCCRDGDSGGWSGGSGGGEAPPKQPAKGGRGRGRWAGHVPKGRGGGSK
jgi:hypothetical protein